MFLTLLTMACIIPECDTACRQKQISFAKYWGAHYARRYNVPKNLVYAVIRTESNFDPDALSHAGAIGYMQLLPSTAQAMGVDPYNPRGNIRGGVKYLSILLRRFQDEDLAIAAYNAGPSLVARLGRVPRIVETQKYVVAVLRRKGEF